MNKVLVMVTIILSVSCKKNVESVILPSVATNPITYISDNSALTGGNITNDGGGAIINRGICFDVFPLPTIEKNKIESGSGSGSFTSIMNGLIVDKLYYVRAYATNSAGTSYGKELKYRRITTKPGAGVSFNGYNYKSVILGNGQEWITENLRTSTFSNGVPIKEVKRDIDWERYPYDILLLNDARGAWCYYGNDPSNENKYGKLYNWYVFYDSRNVCPSGWHVSTNEEWKMLTDYLIEDVAGGKLKSTDTETWESPNTGATNESGFFAQPGGFRSSNGSFSKIGSTGRWWSYEFNQFDKASSRTISNTSVIVQSQDIPKSFGQSIRCVKD